MWAAAFALKLWTPTVLVLKVFLEFWCHGEKNWDISRNWYSHKIPCRPWGPLYVEVLSFLPCFLWASLKYNFRTNMFLVTKRNDIVFAWENKAWSQRYTFEKRRFSGALLGSSHQDSRIPRGCWSDRTKFRRNVFVFGLSECTKR